MKRRTAKDWLKESVIGECEERDDFRVFDAEYLNVPNKEREGETAMTRHESDDYKTITAIAELHGCRAFRRNVGFRGGVVFGVKGQSDIYGWHRHTGRHFEYEVKKRGERPSEAQKAWLTEVSRTGGFAGWGDSINEASEFFADFDAYERRNR